MIEHAAALLTEVDPSGWTPTQRWVTLLSGVGLSWVTLLGGLVVTVRKVGGVQQSADAAKIAVESSPTANGYAAETKNALREIIAGMARVESKVDTHIADHASADVQRSRGH